MFLIFITFMFVISKRPNYIFEKRYDVDNLGCSVESDLRSIVILPSIYGNPPDNKTWACASGPGRSIYYYNDTTLGVQTCFSSCKTGACPPQNALTLWNTTCDAQLSASVPYYVSYGFLNDGGNTITMTKPFVLFEYYSLADGFECKTKESLLYTELRSDILCSDSSIKEYEGCYQGNGKYVKATCSDGDGKVYYPYISFDSVNDVNDSSGSKDTLTIVVHTLLLFFSMIILASIQDVLMY